MKIEPGDEFVLEEGRCWIIVGNIAVLVHKGDEGASVSLYPNHGGDPESLGETWATYAEAEACSKEYRKRRIRTWVASE